MNDKTKAFLDDLKAVFNKHGVRLDGYSDYYYDGEDELPAGTVYYLAGYQIYVNMADLEQYLNG